MKTYGPVVFLALLLFACSSAETSASSESALETDALDAELPIVSFDDTSVCTLSPTAPGVGDFKCVSTRPSLSGFPTLAAGMIVRATTATGNTAEWTNSGGATLRVRETDMPIRVDVRLDGGNYGIAGTSVSYTIGSLNGDANAQRTIQLPFELFRAFVIAPGIESIAYTARATSDVTPWASNGSSAITTEVAVTARATDGRVRIALPVPRGGAVTASLEIGETKLEDVPLSRAGYFVFADGALRPASAGDLEAADISDDEVNALRARREGDAALCARLVTSCQIDSNACIARMDRLSAAQRSSLSEPGCRSSCDSLKSCIGL